MNRRQFLSSAAAVPLAPGIVRAGILNNSTERAFQDAPAAGGATKRKGRIKHSACRWCYGGIGLDDLCKAMAQMGGHSIELLDEKEWGVPAKHGLVCALGNGPGNIPEGWNRVENHDRLAKEFERMIPIAKEAGVPTLITFSGNRRGISDDEGMKHCIDGLKKIAGAAEKSGVNIVLELLNSKVDHHDYQCDRTAFGAGVVKGVGSPRVKLLYDIYHMQIMEGDVIRTIRDNISIIGHFHTGGIPGRGEIDETQELYYPAVMRAIADAGYQGYVSQEFMPPSKNPLGALRKAIDICDI
ncbi:MAG: TIM barrel protein [Planctomycetes bacterium]|nr:TIM barrel protein [Planctomycetota bacterium]